MSRHELYALKKMYNIEITGRKYMRDLIACQDGKYTAVGMWMKEQEELERLRRLVILILNPVSATDVNDIRHTISTLLVEDFSQVNALMLDTTICCLIMVYICS